MMNSITQTLRYNWHPMRVVYLLLAAAILAQAWEVKDWTIGLLGGLFLYQSVFNAGCCGATINSFDSGKTAPDQRSIRDTDYTEIK